MNLTLHSYLPNDCIQLLKFFQMRQLINSQVTNMLNKCKNNSLFHQLVEAIPENKLEEFIIKVHQWTLYAGLRVALHMF